MKSIHYSCIYSCSVLKQAEDQHLVVLHTNLSFIKSFFSDRCSQKMISFRCMYLSLICHNLLVLTFKSHENIFYFICKDNGIYILACNFMWCLEMSSNVISCHVMSFGVMWCHIIMNHVTVKHLKHVTCNTWTAQWSR